MEEDTEMEKDLLQVPSVDGSNVTGNMLEVLLPSASD